MIRKILAAILVSLMAISPAWAVVQFTVNVPTSSSDLASNFPAEAVSQWSIFQTLLQNYRQGYYLTYNNATTLNIGAGEVTVWNGTAALFLQNVSVQTATKSNLDTGSTLSPSTQYFVYCGTSSITAATCTVTISLNNAAPSGVTYYKQLGNFTTDSNGNIAQIFDNSVVVAVKASSGFGVYSVGTIYQATTDGQLQVRGQCGLNPTLSFAVYSDASPTPSMVVGACNSSSTTTNVNGTWAYPLIRKGYYWQATGNVQSINWVPLGQ